jgi:hypothetical protein
MSHIYQPVMLKALLEGDGKASLRAIAAGFLAHDQAQLEYYEEITTRMPGRVLKNHGCIILTYDALDPLHRDPGHPKGGAGH